MEKIESSFEKGWTVLKRSIATGDRERLATECLIRRSWEGKAAAMFPTPCLAARSPAEGDDKKYMTAELKTHAY